MALLRPKWLRLLTLALLYFVQGAPYGFQVSCLPMILRQYGLSFTALGSMKLLFLPWVCKPVYAPLIERTRSKYWWLTRSMLALGLTCILAAWITGPDTLTSISILMFALNLFSATQDVATDSLAVNILEPAELAAGNTIQVVAYKAGSVFAGGLLLWVEELTSWAGMFYAFGAIYFVCIFLLSQFSWATAHPSNATSTGDERAPGTNPNLRTVLRDVLSVPNTGFIMGFVCFYKLCERAEQTFSLFMIDKGVPLSQIAFWSTIMRTGSLLGSVYGGHILTFDDAESRPREIICKYSFLRSLPITLQLILIHQWGVARVPSESVFLFWNSDTVYMYLGFFCTTITLFCAGVITTATFTVMMRLSQTAPDPLKGTHFTTLATCEVGGKLLFASLSGGLIDALGLYPVFMSFVMLALGCVPLACYLPSKLPPGTKMNQ
ncbi:hypothetical protein TCAL_08117 [Tigriopus californicus]|uniref:Major facilitator superfamily (MFS) profile domain-containing protein n=1 Tax=Tigriopus californicus TaxID=6832 RepID=A0A553PJQ1_TIGCA|nr:major facilitator superfamily domain-containing protein 3-like [Tigriopus californicus]TRY77902.1 hypothetical protein TCAL_08117 [Tigriopus californicus]|eukprot:TCALIF_08117-PA protein Name:"Similar to Mfsd3 Major facilitator superfamily domain-containing protein 3 (Rattus norvegicus)" AED:0.28 eAED:0.30 QI:0/-1/0/1/-1/1/1/0/435